MKNKLFSFARQRHTIKPHRKILHTIFYLFEILFSHCLFAYFMEKSKKDFCCSSEKRVKGLENCEFFCLSHFFFHPCSLCMASCLMQPSSSSREKGFHLWNAIKISHKLYTSKSFVKFVCVETSKTFLCFVKIINATGTDSSRQREWALFSPRSGVSQPNNTRTH